MIKPYCNMCGNELEDFGAILLSPPDKEDRIKNIIFAKSVLRK